MLAAPTSGHDGDAQVHIVNAAQPVRPPRLVQRRAPGLQYFLEHQFGCLVILTNACGGPEYGLMTCELGRCARECAPLTSAPPAPHAGCLLVIVGVDCVL